MPRPLKTKPITAQQTVSYLNKAIEFLKAAENELEAGRTMAATSLAIHSAINSGDAVCGARLGSRAKADDHSQIFNLLKQAGPDGQKVEKELARLLPLKTKSEYEPDDIALSTATKAVERADRCAQVARLVVETTSG
jgi:HEPN domain-containing protein